MIAALLCLTLADVNATSGAGPIGAMGIAIAMLAMLTLLPALLLIFGRPVFWPFVPAPELRRKTCRSTSGRGSRTCIARRPGMITIGVFALMAVMALGLLNRPGGLDITQQLPQAASIRSRA